MNGLQLLKMKRTHCLLCDRTTVMTKLTITNGTFSTTDTLHSNHHQCGALASGFTLGTTKPKIGNTADSPCAAGWKCSMIFTTGGGTIPVASARHRCPGIRQDFLSCNKPIHAICGVEIEDLKMVTCSTECVLTVPIC